MLTTSQEERAARVAGAGYNVLLLDEADVELDLATDIPTRSYVEEVRDAGIRALREGAREPDVHAAASRLYGEARYVVTTRGRTAETVLARALLREGDLVLTHTLFPTTGAAIARAGAKAALVPTRGAGTCDLDITALRERFASGRVAAVWVEAANNSNGGWPLSLEGLRAVAEACRENDAKLVLDATRLLGNCMQLGLPLSAAAEFAGLADAFTVSVAKEGLVPVGALIAVRDKRLEDAVFVDCYSGGYRLEPVAACVQMVAGLEHVAGHPELFANRSSVLAALSARLRERGVPVLEPHGPHAIFVDLEKRLGAITGEQARALEVHLYERFGIRSLVSRSDALGRTILRIAFPLARFDERVVEHVAASVASLIQDASEQRLRKLVMEQPPPPFPVLARYTSAPA